MGGFHAPKQRVDADRGPDAAGDSYLWQAAYFHGDPDASARSSSHRVPGDGVCDGNTGSDGQHTTRPGDVQRLDLEHHHGAHPLLPPFTLSDRHQCRVATTVPAFPGFPIGVSSGAYDHVLDLTSVASYNPMFVTAQGGVAAAEAALIKGIVNGETYLNIHTTTNPGGEIRGFLVASPTPAQLSLLTTIPINGTAASPSTKLYSFDISFVDPANGLYYLADRSNKALDVVDTTGNFTGIPDTLYGQIGGAAFGFAGDVQNPNGLSNTAISGPDGVVAGFPCIFAGDAGSRLISINGAA